MHNNNSLLIVKYGAALVAAPVFCLFYIWIFQQKSGDIYWLLHDGRSFFFLVLFYPIIEELTFRGIVQEYIASKTNWRYLFSGLSVANLLTSFLFVLIHFVHHTPIWAVSVFIPSLIFGYFKERFDWILPSIFLHMFYNFNFFSFIGH